MRANVQLHSLLLVGCANFQFIAARALRPNAMIVGMNVFFHGYRPPFMLIDKSALYHFICASSNEYILLMPYRPKRPSVMADALVDYHHQGTIFIF